MRVKQNISLSFVIFFVNHVANEAEKGQLFISHKTFDRGAKCLLAKLLKKFLRSDDRDGQTDDATHLRAVLEIVVFVVPMKQS